MRWIPGKGCRPFFYRNPCASRKQATAGLANPRLAPPRVFVRTRARALTAAVDYDRKAVVVEYEVESAVIDEFGEVLRVERKPHRKLYVPRAEGGRGARVFCRLACPCSHSLAPHRPPTSAPRWSTSRCTGEILFVLSCVGVGGRGWVG